MWINLEKRSQQASSAALCRNPRIHGKDLRANGGVSVSYGGNPGPSGSCTEPD